MKAEQALVRAVEIIGSQTAAAAKIGRTPQAVSEMLCRGGKAPAEWVLPLEAATNGQITRHQLRPDLYPAETGRVA